MFWALLRWVVVTAVLGSSSAALALDPRTVTSQQFFDPERVYTFELSISSDDFERMPPAVDGGGRALAERNAASPTVAAENPGYRKVPATLRFEGSDWGPIQVRYKGNSSYRGARSFLKRSLKLYFGTPGERGGFFGLRELNLNNNAFDSSQMRETLGYEVFRQAGVPAPRTTYARVFLTVPGQHDHEYAGLFTIVEEIDQRFFESRWGGKVGVLLKPEGLTGLPDLGSDWKSYAKSYSAKGASQSEDTALMMAFIQFVDHASDTELAQHLADYLDVDEFLRFLATEAVIVNSDSPLAMNHNYYLTIHPDTQKVVWVPWDLNMAFGGFRRGEVDLSIDHPSGPGAFPLAERVLANSQLLARYRQIISEMLSTNVTRPRLDAEMQRLVASLNSAVAQDPTANKAQFAANFSMADHAARTPRAPSDVQQFGRITFRDHDGPNLQPFIHQRIDSVREQLQGERSGVPGRTGFGSWTQ